MTVDTSEACFSQKRGRDGRGGEGTEAVLIPPGDTPGALAGQADVSMLCIFKEDLYRLTCQSMSFFFQREFSASKDVLHSIIYHLKTLKKKESVRH